VQRLSMQVAVAALSITWYVSLSSGGKVEKVGQKRKRKWMSEERYDIPNRGALK
jgi:hypothetical protein